MRGCGYERPESDGGDIPFSRRSEGRGAAHEYSHRGNVSEPAERLFRDRPVEMGSYYSSDLFFYIEIIRAARGRALR